MADKLRRQFPIKITFVDGEQPTASKMNALSTQTRNGMATLEKAIGDLWNSSGDATLNSFPLQIPNLARLLGENKYLNPALVPVGSAFEFTEELGLRYENKNTGYLLLPPSSATLTIVDDGGAFTGAAVSNESDVDVVGEWWVENNTGKFRTAKAMDSTAAVTYTVDPTTLWIPGQKTLPGIIPDPRQSTFTGCKITLEGGKFYLHLPPRQPLTLTSIEKPERYPSTAEAALAGNRRSTAGVGTKKYWQHSTTALTGNGDSFYRYALPEELQSIGLGEEIPRGTLYLWNLSTDSIIEDIIFKMPAPAESARQGFQLEVSSATFDFNTLATSSGSQIEADYSGTSLVLVTCASPVTRSIWNLMNLFMKHDHSNKGTLEPSISHDDLKDSNPTPAGTAAPYSAPYPSYVRHWRPSKWANDSHSSLLSRSGAQTTSGRERDLHNNAMLGHLLLANADTSGSENYLAATLPDTSFKLYFGNTDANSPNIYATVSGLQLDPTGSKKVSIGTLSPLSKLSLAGNLAIGATYAGNNAAPTNGLLVEGYVGIGTSSATTGQLNVRLGGSGTVGYFASDLWVASLDVESLDGLGGPTPVKTSLISASDLLRGSTGTVTNHPFDIITNNTAKLTVLANGNVGIGTNNPASNQLHIQNSTGGYQGYIYSSGGSSGGLLIKNQAVELSFQASTGSGTAFIGTLSNDSLTFKTNGLNQGSLSATGVLAFGTVSVATNTVFAVGKTDDCFIQIQSSNVSNKKAGILFGDSFDQDIGRIQYDNTSNQLEFITNNSEVMRLDANGKLLIGTTLGTLTSGYLNQHSNNEFPLISRMDSGTNTHRHHLLFQRTISNGTVTNNTILGGIAFGGWNSAAMTLGYDGGAEINAIATENWSTTIQGTKLVFSTTKNGDTSVTETLALTEVSSGAEFRRSSGNFIFVGNAIVTPNSSSPGTGVTGAIMFDTTAGKLKIYTGSSWETITST